MAIYVFKMKTFSRNAGSRGSRATSAAAYRAGERIRDTRTGACYDHRHRQDVLHKQIMLPRALAALPGMDWARNRATLWNAAEHAETRGNARVAREFTLALPHELTQSARVRLAQRFAQDLADRYHNAIDLVIHAPRGDARNYHAHLLTTTREVTPQGLGHKAALELTGTERHRRGLARWAQERAWLREHWAGAANEALREAGLDVRISHRFPSSPNPMRPAYLPLTAYHIEQAGRHSYVAERIRARHRAQLEQAQRAGLQRQRAQAEPVPARDWLQSMRSHVQTVWSALRDGLGFGRIAAPAERPFEASALRAAEMPSDGGQPPPTRQPGKAAPEAVRAWLEYRHEAAEHAAASTQPDSQRSHEAAVEAQLPPARGNDYDLGL